MIRKLEVKGLNTRVDGVWEFHEDLNIITGKNGSGKTTLLKLIWYSISGNLEQIISAIPFRLVSIETDSFFLCITQDEHCTEGKLTSKFANGEKEVVRFQIPLQRQDIELTSWFYRQIPRPMNRSLFFPSFSRVEGGFARHYRYTATEDWLRHYSEQAKRKVVDETTEMLEKGLSQLSTEVSIDGHQFITSTSTHDIVELLTEKYAGVSSKTNELHAKLSEEITQKISKTNPLENATPVLKDIQKRVEQVTKERESLLKPFSVLGERIRDIFQYEGIRVTKEITLGEAKEAIESDKLSAGEKQMLSFLCYNTFNDNAAIFIDEPELSLHVDWQRRLLPTLLEQETGNQFFIATHSPFIYAKYPDKEILLGEDRGGS